MNDPTPSAATRAVDALIRRQSLAYGREAGFPDRPPPGPNRKARRAQKAALRAAALRAAAR